MATAKRFSIYPASLVHAGGTLNLAQLQAFRVGPAPAIKRVYVGGAVDPKANILTRGDPRVELGTRDLTTLLTTLNPLTGLASFGAGATFRLQERDDGESVFLSGLTHETFVVNKYHLVLNSISAQQDDQDGLLANLTCHALYDGTNNPIIHNTGVDFAAAPAPAFASEFWMGPVYHNAVQVEGITGWSVEFGVQFTPFRTSGAVWPTQGYIARRQPVLRATSLKVDVVANLVKELRALAGTFAVYGWKGADASHRVAVGSGVHLKISCAAGAWGDDEIAATENDDGTFSAVIMPTGTLAMSIASTIP